MHEQEAKTARGQVLSFPPVDDRCSAASRAQVLALERQFRDHLQTKLSLCCALEEVADGLRPRSDLGRARMLLSGAGPLLEAAHRFEERDVFPLLRRAFSAAPGLPDTLARLEQEHIEDAAFTGELLEACTGLIEGGPGPDDNTFGYMLRGFFGALRRHVAFEREHVLPLLAGLR